MKDYPKILKEILRSSKWTQSQLAAKLGVSFATINSWINGKSKPRESMAKKIQDLYVARDITSGYTPTYITIVGELAGLHIDDLVSLVKIPDDDYDCESIAVKTTSPMDSGATIYVANSPELVFKGTWSAGRIYDKITGTARAQIKFLSKKAAIAQIISWDLDGDFD